MFATNLLERRRKPQRITDQAWDQLVSAVGSAGDAARLARRHTSHMASEAGHRVGPATGEARHRAMAAVDALAGRRPAMPWAWIAGAAAAGVALGWLAGAMARSAIAHRDGADSVDARIEFVEVDEPTGSSLRP
ncbi:hypothetical protein [Micromonospora sp. NBC_01813]|uniref:hypothetical protein n=1 Tax=Micromonospora sp. NBC_01813 TaxID=2975988 RepID=UPI002DDAD84C|nr:hypothetical protein [Micromonospora sp. NBC_01813]WSA09421.1 hypothetical protein OG958_00880 [Micromonospora sp. NBC_01813]